MRSFENPCELQAKELQFIIGAISHDLRTPLRAMDAYMHLLAGEIAGSASDIAHRYIERASRSVQVMRALVDDLLDYVSTGQGTMAKEPIDLSEMARGIIAELAVVEPTRVVVAHIEPGLRTIGDPILIRRLLHNLLSNAWKFTRDVAGATIRFYRADTYTFCVEDNGCGFATSDADALFVPYHRLKHTRADGYGLGLAIAQRIVALHGGSIRAEGELFRGARFCFSLPGDVCQS
jgi:hypothetical protein